MSSTGSAKHQHVKAGHKRGISETSATGPSSIWEVPGDDSIGAGGYKNARQSLRPLPQPPNSSLRSTFNQPEPTHIPLQNLEDEKKYQYEKAGYSPKSDPIQSYLQPSALGRSDSVKPSSISKRLHQTHASPLGPIISSPDLNTLKKSSTSHFKTLSKFAQQESCEDFSLTSPAPSVIGLLGRRQLKRTDSTGGARAVGKLGHERGSAWAERNWIDKQRQFLQAYEYLCHIGEAKEWIEDVIHSSLPPIVQLEEALRDGVTLAEVVQALSPDQPIRIFRHPKLQFRHSDNIAVFFRFLAQVELPELFRFELIDLYEKKNIPKVIHCIHALSWLLYRKGVVNFRIGNLVGQLQFEHHELEEMQKGLDKAGISMPSFAGMEVSFAADPVPQLEPEPQLVESHEERVQRVLEENEVVIIDFQAQARGAMIRSELGEQMQHLWDAEEMLINLQALVRGTWARQIYQYRLGMRLFTINLQSAARGFVERARQRNKKDWWRANEDKVILMQSIVRGQRSRNATDQLRISTRRGESGVKRLQSAIRGALRRKKIDEQLEQITYAETAVHHLQAAIRGALQRKVIDEQFEETRHAETAVNYLQAAIRGAWNRKAVVEKLKLIHREEAKAIQLQAAVRGTLQRAIVAAQIAQTQEAEICIKQLQAAIRGALRRQSIDEQIEQTRVAEADVIRLQATLRGVLQRRRLHSDKCILLQSQDAVMGLQAATRGMIVRSRKASINLELENLSGTWCALQTLARGLLLRRSLEKVRKQLLSRIVDTVKTQAAVRGQAARRNVDRLKSLLSSVASETVTIQSASRGYLLRKRCLAQLESLHENASQVSGLQNCIRGWLARRRSQQLQWEIVSHAPEIIHLQALTRAMIARSEVGNLLNQLEDQEIAIAELQSAIRGVLVREKFAEKKRFFKANMEKVVKVQSFIRGRLQGEAYKSLTNGTNPPVGTVKGFVHLLNDSDFDFDEEIEFERLRKTVVQHVRQNELADQYITQLDIKIALLVKNKITLDEVVKHQKHFGGDAGHLLTNTEISSKDPFDLKALNKTSRRKLEHYQELFFILQTQPQYLARLFRRIREQGTAEKECERIKHLMMGVFGYAQKRREEYYLIKLITRSMKEEIEKCPSIKDYLRGNFFWAKLFAAYVKSPRDRKYMRDTLAQIIKDSIIDVPDLDLESDPMLIYLSAIENEQLRTGKRSHRNPDIPREEAIRDDETKRTFIVHLQDLREIADQILAALEDQLHKMPFGVRYIAQQMFQNLTARFKHDEQGHILQIVGHWVWKAYLQPALTEPEKFGVLDRGLSQGQRRNIGEVAKLVGQVAVGRLFGSENVFLQPLNSYVGESIQRLGVIWDSCKATS